MSAYYKKDPKLVMEVDGFLEKGISTDQVYSAIAKKNRRYWKLNRLWAQNDYQQEVCIKESVQK